MGDSQGKHYSNGLDLAWLRPTLDTTNYGLIFRKKFSGMLIRLLTFPMPTIAAMNGKFVPSFDQALQLATGRWLVES